jgi:hypothetical protein
MTIKREKEKRKDLRMGRPEGTELPSLLRRALAERRAFLLLRDLDFFI